MLNIIICDDDNVFAQRVKEEIEVLIAPSRIPVKIQVFSCAEDIGNETMASCDVAFLDIDFTGKQYSGMDIAKRIRKYETDAIIVFITNYLEYAPAGYEVRAFRYILKNELPQKLQESIRQIVSHIRTEKADIKIQADGEIVDLLLKEIIYVEAMDHTLIFHVSQRKRGDDKQYICYSTLKIN
ncbi:MAG: LytTR family DNA-binding domain-containing protein [Bacillota bacterium]|nr:LytTR family DNA-binding domain-containing protein [Bacillota bacterium]